MRILAIGGTSFIGPPAVRLLAQRGHELLLFHRGRNRPAFEGDVSELIGDRKNFSDFAGKMIDFKPDAVLDMWPLSRNDSRTVVETFRGTAKRHVAISSQDVYKAFGIATGFDPAAPIPGPIGEESPLREKFFLYREMSPRLRDYEKILAEREVMGDPDLPGTVLRLPAVFGPGDYQHRLAPYLKMMEEGNEIVLDATGALQRSTRLYVENAAYAILLALENEKASNRIYNAGDEHALSEEEWVSNVCKAAGWEGRITVKSGLNAPEGNPSQDMVASTAKIREELGYSERFELAIALKRTIEWERESAGA